MRCVPQCHVDTVVSHTYMRCVPQCHVDTVVSHTYMRCVPQCHVARDSPTSNQMQTCWHAPHLGCQMQVMTRVVRCRS